MTTTHYDDTPTESHNTLPPGTYRARPVEMSWDTAKSGDPCLAVMFELIDGRPGWRLDGRLYLDTDKQDSKGRTSYDRSMEALRAMGLDGDLMAELPELSGEVSLVTDINERGYAFVKWINAPRSARELRTFAVPDTGSLNGFLAKLNARSRAMSAGARAIGSQPVQTTQPQRQTPAQRAAGQNAGPAQGGQQRRHVQQPQKPATPPRTMGMGGDFPSDGDDIPF